MAYYTSNNKIGSFEIACEREHCSKISGHINIKALFVHFALALRTFSDVCVFMRNQEFLEPMFQ